MSTDLADFRELIGLMPRGRLCLLRSLLDRPTSLDDLIQASALPRRDVEDFLTSLNGLELDESGQRYVLAGQAGDAYRRLCQEFAERRPRLSPAGEGELRRAAERLVSGVPTARKGFDQVQATAETAVRRVKWLTDNFNLSLHSILFVGDHDLTSLLLSYVVADAKLTVVDIDERLLAYIEDSAEWAGLPRIDCVFADFRFGLPPALAQSADVIFTDPPYTSEGLSLFLSRSLASLHRHNLDSRVVIAFGHSRRRPDLGLAAQREILRSETVIDCVIPHFNRYLGAQAVGSASDLYSCQPTARAFHRIDRQAETDGPRGIYTQGEHSVESAAVHSAADVLKLLPNVAPSGTAEPRNVGLVAVDPGPAPEFGVAVSLGKLLESGVHYTVTQRVGEFVVDLRDDPGPWLLRSLLALNADKAAFILRPAHEGLGELTAGSGPWDLVRAKFSLATARELPGLGLTVLQCELAGTATAGDGVAGFATGDGAASSAGGLYLARYVLRRAHGRLRNVWREGLIELASQSGKTMTKREAVDLAQSHAGGYGNDLALRLIDVPAHHFGALGRAFVSSAAAL
jgi:N4-bis(aminopropyl)spermidine synthase